MTKSEIPPIKKTDNCYEDIDINKTQLFNEYFITQSTVDDSGVDLPPLTYNQTCSIDNIDITETDVKDVLDNLDISKATGPDGINPRLLKEASSELCGPLSKFFNRSLEIAKYPSVWKEANVSPIYKKDDPSLVKNYRPISLLNILGKVMERCIFKHIYNYIVSNNLLTPLQSGFRQKDSTIFQLLDITNQFGKALDDGKEIRVIFCDISKAFDRVWHLGLIHKLSTFGISGSLLSWFSDYLHFRRQRVVINGTSSDWLEITAGVPQGSIPGPLLFLIYINNIVTDIRSNIRLFADDTSLYIIIENPITASETLNFDLDTIHEWSSNWLVDFNPQKTEIHVVTLTKDDRIRMYSQCVLNKTDYVARDKKTTLLELPQLPPVSPEQLEKGRQIIEEHRNDGTYVPTNAANKGKEILSKKNILIIKGRIGSGKTKTALHIASEWMKEDEKTRQCIYLNSIDDHRMLNVKDNTCFVLDDCFTRWVLESSSPFLPELCVLLPTQFQIQNIEANNDDIQNKGWDLQQHQVVAPTAKPQNTKCKNTKQTSTKRDAQGTRNVNARHRNTKHKDDHTQTRPQNAGGQATQMNM
ncbi:hypothetical protein FSP39_012507 [Pinctada imbricata]|uniref:Reverse transcriptase domain-containing protein n=1 Tax=Pinctada imbricata TaxID=66713 RepID=A0AA89C6B7_PINIB|nr:hypothetical protein FSP39_012507 [Pinctada imbricata]